MTTTEPGQHTVCYRHKNIETAVSCSDCGKPICPDCMVFGPVGIRCPDCSGQREASAQRNRPRPSVRSLAASGSSDIVTRAMVGLIVLIYVAQVAESGDISGAGDVFISPSGDINGTAELFTNGALYGPAVNDGEWWRLVTSAFLHSGPIHLFFNGLILWWFGRSLESLVGSRRFLSIYLISMLAGAAGALLFSPNSFTVGASGAVFGVLGAGLVLERRGIMVFGGAALPIVAFNVVLSFVIPRISIGGHLGGLVGGAVVILILSRLGRSNPAYTRITAPVVVGLIAVAVASVLIAYLRVSA
ncbi:MAG: rhomboid family intramembrane serine protease [Gaiellaceae bacterium]